MSSPPDPSAIQHRPEVPLHHLMHLPIIGPGLLAGNRPSVASEPHGPAEPARPPPKLPLPLDRPPESLPPTHVLGLLSPIMGGGAFTIAPRLRLGFSSPAPLCHHIARLYSMPTAGGVGPWDVAQAGIVALRCWHPSAFRAGSLHGSRTPVIGVDPPLLLGIPGDEVSALVRGDREHGLHLPIPGGPRRTRTCNAPGKGRVLCQLS